ncbi:hypothetical protein GCM10023093_00750 [Nemorincola caseinilytica]|uniref:Phage holin family protein n=1 Tax=Nemorincola caseinilytica TaxID=2054315 RepID=A0ABP8N485_9BACT
MGIFSGIKDRITRYIEVQVDLVKIDLIGRTAGVVSYVLFALIGLLIFFCIVLFIGFGLTSAFIQMGVSPLAAYFITTGIYILLLALVVVLRRPITRFFADSLVEVITSSADDEGDEAEQNKKA